MPKIHFFLAAFFCLLETIKNLNISFMLFSQSYYKFNKQHQKINISATPYVYCLVSTDIKKPT